jgi:methylenetetrahydrofolate--tRNA-(uracil-5-)-methyltransferase
MASRWDKGQSEEDQRAYVNCPLSEREYFDLVSAIRAARKVEPHAFEEVRYFEGCLPIEVMAERGERTLAFGPLKPVGLVDPRSGRRPYAVVQLRKEDEAGTAYNMVGFQTRMVRGEQQRVFSMIPGLEKAEFLRFGAVHRNTFLDSPRVLTTTLELKSAPELYFAGQITGTEGYVESAAGGWLAAWFISRRLQGASPAPPPATTAHGGLLTHLSRGAGVFQPSNITFSHLPPWDGPRLGKRDRAEAVARRALKDLESYIVSTRDEVKA